MPFDHSSPTPRNSAVVCCYSSIVVHRQEICSLFFRLDLAKSSPSHRRCSGGGGGGWGAFYSSTFFASTSMYDNSKQCRFNLVNYVVACLRSIVLPSVPQENTPTRVIPSIPLTRFEAVYILKTVVLVLIQQLLLLLMWMWMGALHFTLYTAADFLLHARVLTTCYTSIYYIYGVIHQW